MTSSSLCRAAVMLLFSAALVRPPAVVSSKVKSSPANSWQLDNVKNQVVVDLVVTDDANQPVRGLRAEDFQIFEDNKVQSIVSFEPVEVQRESENAKPALLPANVFTNANSFKPNSINVILLDQVSTTLDDQKIALQQVIDAVTTKPAEASFAIFVLRNDDMACQPYNRVRWAFGITEPAPDTDWGCTSRGRILLAQGVTQDKDRLLAALNSSVVRPHPIWPRLRLGQGLSAFTFGPEEVVDTSMSALAELGLFLGRLPGRKSLIWLSDKFDAAPIAQYIDVWVPPKFKGWDKVDPFSPILMIHLTADRFAVGRAAIYPVDLTGKTKKVQLDRQCLNFFDPFTNEPELNLQDCTDSSYTLEDVASQSGGRLFHGSDEIRDAIAQAVADSSNYYGISYSPTKPEFDSKIRQIKVNLPGKKYHLQYRNRYYADDPSTLNSPEGSAPSEVVLPNASGLVPWKVARVIDPNTAQAIPAREPILSVIGYGTPESNDITFEARIEPTAKFTKARSDQLAHLQEFESFMSERVQKAMAHLTKTEQKKQHKGRTELDSLPSPDPVYVQPYSVDFAVAANQVNLQPTDNGRYAFRLEVAIIAYDALGKKVNGLKESIDASFPGSFLQQFQASGYHTDEKIDIPDRVSVLRLGVRDVSSNRVGSLEIPLQSVKSPYRRKQLKLPSYKPTEQITSSNVK